MSAVISTNAYDSILKIGAGLYAKQYNGINDINAQAGYIADVCGTNGISPSMGNDDYMADLDGVNLYVRFRKNNNDLYTIFTNYYIGIKNNNIIEHESLKIM